MRPFRIFIATFVALFALYFFFADIHASFGRVARFNNVAYITEESFRPGSPPRNVEFDSRGVKLSFAPGARGLSLSLSENADTARIWIKTERGLKLCHYSHNNPQAILTPENSDLVWINILADGCSEKEPWWNPKYVIEIKK